MAANFSVFYLIYFIPILVLSLLPLVLCIPYGCIWYWRKYPERKCSKRIIRVLKCCKPWSMHNLVRYMFGKVFKPGDDDSKENPQTIIFNNYYVPNLFVYELVFLTFQVFSLSLAIFWENFLFKISFSCDDYIPNFDYCFNISYLSYDEANCLDLDDIPVSDVICFRLVFDWSASFSATGGFFIVLSFLIAVIPWIVLKITNGDQATKKCKITGKILRYVLVLIMLVVFYLNYYFQAISYRRKFLVHIAEFFQVTGLLFAFTVIIRIPWWNFKKVINGVHMGNNDNMECNVKVGSDEYQLLTT